MGATSKLATSSILDIIKWWLGAIKAELTWVSNLPGRGWTAICNLITTVTDALLDFVIVVGKGVGIALAIYVAFVAILKTDCLIVCCLQKARLFYERVAREKAACHADEAQTSHHQQQSAHERTTRHGHQQTQRLFEQEHNSRREAEQARAEEVRGSTTYTFRMLRHIFEGQRSVATVTHYTPEPPHWLCGKECTTVSRVLQACKHNLQELFTSNGDPSTLRKDIMLWHPNNAIFAKMENDGLTGAMAYATEIAAVISGLMPTRST
ncbi:hypothetical protein LTS10_004702 [Elasticomyces elasticus]|nr:hypothetical protein LTS10_004702 [Elasticomyces elasticus]